MSRRILPIILLAGLVSLLVTLVACSSTSAPPLDLSSARPSLLFFYTDS